MILRSSQWLLPAYTFIQVLFLLVGPVFGDADFESVRWRFGYEDMSGRHGDPPGKYWRQQCRSINSNLIADPSVCR